MSRAVLIARELAGAVPSPRRCAALAVLMLGMPCWRLSLSRPMPRSPGLTWRFLRGGAPLPIPNREVKPRSADDTAVRRGKVGRRPPIADGFSLSAFFYALFSGHITPVSKKYISLLSDMFFEML